MAKNVTLGTLWTRAQQLANMENTTFVTSTEGYDLINRHCADLYDILVDASPPDYYSTDNTITTVSGTLSYALPSDFRSLIAVYAQEQTDYYRPLEQISDIDRVSYRSPPGAYTVILRYTPAFTDLANANSTFDGINGWDEYVASMAARDMLMKEESDTSAIDMKIERLRERIESTACKRNQGSSWPITDVDTISRWPYPYRQSVNAYQLRGNYLDLFTCHPVWP